MYTSYIYVHIYTTYWQIKKLLQMKLAELVRGSEFLSYEIKLWKRVTQNDVTLRVTKSKIFRESLFSSY